MVDKLSLFRLLHWIKDLPSPFPLQLVNPLGIIYVRSETVFLLGIHVRQGLGETIRKETIKYRLPILQLSEHKGQFGLVLVSSWLLWQSGLTKSDLFQLTAHHWEKPGQALKQALEAETVEEHCLLAFSWFMLSSLILFCPGLPAADWCCP